MVSYIYLGYGVTSSNGIAKLDHNASGTSIDHSYTGSGAGKIDVVASTDSTISSSSLVSEPYEVLDCIFYDEATSSDTKNTNWTASNISVDLSNGYAELSKTNSASTGNYTCGTQINEPCTIEFTNYLAGYGDNYIFIGSDYLSLGTVTANSTVKVVVTSTKATLFVDDVQKVEKNLTGTLSSGLNIVLRIHSSSPQNIGYSDFKVYP